MISQTHASFSNALSIGFYLRTATLLLTVIMNAEPAEAKSSPDYPTSWSAYISQPQYFSQSTSPYTANVSTDASTASVPSIVQVINPTNTSGLNPYNMSWNGQTTLNMTINAGSSPVSISNNPYLYLMLGQGVIDNVDTTFVTSWALGPNMNISNSANLTLNNSAYPTYSDAVLLAESFGASGYAQSGKGTTDVVWGGSAGGTVNFTHAGSITVFGQSTPPNLPADLPFLTSISGIMGSSYGGAGVGGKANDNDFAGNGGNGGAVGVTTNQGSLISLQGSGNSINTINGITAYSQGAQPGCDCSGDHANVFGDSGSGGAINVDHNGTISSTANNSIGIFAASIGGTGGLMPGSGVGNSGGGISGPGGAVNVTLENGSVINMLSGNGIGVFAASAVGAANNDYASASNISGGAVAVNITTGASINSTGNSQFNMGVLAISTGSAAILEPFNSNTVTTGGSGYSGDVTVNNAGTISTSGQMAIGVAALSVGGAGIVTNAASSGLSYIGSTATSNANASGGAVSVSNSGSILTNGASAIGLIATSAGAGGLANLTSNAGVNGNSWSNGSIVGGNASDSNPGGTVTVNNTGSITTGDGNGGGNVAIGIIAQSIGGGGGSSGGTGTAAFVGDQGGGGGNGGVVNVTTQNGTILTQDDGALGILAQSIGGGGGNGANAAGVFVATGGQGGTGGNGSTVNVTTGGSGMVSNFTTLGDFASGVIAQSVGGGGGNGGYAKSGGLFISASIGGNGGGGGNGGAVNFTNNGKFTTSGQQSLGILAQSVGGGGGNGGAANSYSVGVALTSSIALGGSGGNGGNGGEVTFNNNYNIATLGADSIGIIAQSIGGGGGNGGSALAKTLAFGTDEIPAVSFSTSLGGSGGGAGSGNIININNAGSTITTGDGAHGLLAQSIGGGGGNGGDSTAGSYAIQQASASVKLSVALGGKGGGGGNGGAVTISNGSYSLCDGCFSYTSTGGNNAAGIAAQSIGGGGGTSTAGSAGTGSPNLGNPDTGTAVSLALSLGASAGGGGIGQVVTVTNLSGNTITTSGSGSPGILAQSIGGGGGYAGGGSSGGSGDDFDLNVGVGGSSGNGGSGNALNVTNSGSISTTQADSVGILAQSIGGGGGVAGSTDPSAAISTAGQVENILNPPSSNSYSANVGVGGTGGSGGSGDTINLSNNGVITTLGSRAYGIEAQSIGGGGGNGGTANASASPSTNNTYSANVAVGGGGGISGLGGVINLSNSAAISTKGYNAHGIMAQSIGGGGGVGGDGSTAANTTIGLGAGINGNGGSSGTAGDVNVTTSQGGTILTLGDDAAGILAQSIGGGGGTATAACTNSVSAGITKETATACFGNVSVSGSTGGPLDFVPRSNINLNVGGSVSAAGNGNTLSISVNDAITTYGARSMGVIAQSIGGGGGYAVAAGQTLSGTGLADSPGSNGATGGPVSVSLASSASITTYGAGAWGILAQSIGGGGGFSGDPSLALTSSVLSNAPQSGSGNAYANTVALTVDGNISTVGINAHGIFAQSIGGSGGIVAGCCNSATANVLAGNTAQFRGASNSDYYGNGGDINLTQGSGSTIKASGSGSIGVIAQSSGNQSTTTGTINLNISGKIIGGTNNGVASGTLGAAGIFLTGGNSASNNPNTITVNQGGFIGTVDGISGTAILTNSGTNTVNNSGTITGNILNGQGTINNQTSGVLNTGSTVTVSNLNNSGTINTGGSGNIATTNINGTFNQSSNGILAVDLNPLAASQKADLLNISGNTTLGGKVTPLFSTLLPGSYTIINGNNIQSTATTPATFLYNWNLNTTSSSLILSPSANFLPSSVALTPSQTSMGNALQALWNSPSLSANTVNTDNQQAVTMATVFNQFYQNANASNYQTMLNNLSSKASTLQGQQASESGISSASGVMSCPGFTGRDSLLQERECVWGKVMGQSRTMNSNSSDANGYSGKTVGFGFGGQKEIFKDWFLGASVSYDNSSYTYSTNLESGNLTGAAGALALKHQMGALQLGASVAYGHSWSDNTRIVQLGNLPATRNSSSPDGNYVAAQIRGAYEFMFSKWYVRPVLDVGVLGLMRDGYTESSPVGLALKVDAMNQSLFYVTPSVDFGMRWDVSKNLLLRPFANIGYTKLTSSDITAKSRLAVMPVSQSFETKAPTLDNMARFTLGVELLKDNELEVKIQYNLNSNNQYTDQGGALKLGYYF